jgi:hypothetical protein
MTSQPLQQTSSSNSIKLRANPPISVHPFLSRSSPLFDSLNFQVVFPPIDSGSLLIDTLNYLDPVTCIVFKSQLQCI